MYELAIRPSLDNKFQKLAKKNKKQLEIIFKKIEEILSNPHHFKNLRKPLQHLKRIHIDKHFVLTYSVDEQTKIITLEDYNHHDKIYL
ncbi:MAG: type II toxin-antitoxin system RelE family toxin [Minisyncoccales bacterium]